MAQQILSTNTFCEAKFVVDADASQGGYTTIAAALTASTSGSTIFIRPGTYTENLTLKAGVNLVAYNADAFTPNVTISGTCTLTAAGSVSMSGIRLQTNSAALLAVTGTLASVVNLRDCYLNCTNNTGITFSTSSGSATISLDDCKGDLGTTGIGLFTHSSAGTLGFKNCYFTNGGASTTASTISAGFLFCEDVSLKFPVTSSSTSSVTGIYFYVDTSAQNVTCATVGGSGSNSLTFSSFNSGSASALSIGAATNLVNSTIISSNTNALTGASTLNNYNVTFGGTSHLSNVTTQTGGAASGITQGTAPSAGFIGEQIRSVIGSGAPQSLSTGTAANITSIALTAGIWDISALFQFAANAATSATSFTYALSPTSATLSTLGDNEGTLALTTALVGYSPSFSIPSFRVTLGASATYYMVAQCTFTVNTMVAYGRITATRVG